MYSNFKEQAIEYVKQAVQEDNAGNYAKAFPLYMNALEYFKTHLKYEKDPKIKEAITQKFTKYLRRAEEIRAVLDDGGPGPASKGDVVEVKVKEEQEAGPGSGPISAEQIRAELSSGAICESPNMYRNFKEQAIEYVKQAVQEDNAGNYARAFPLYMNALEYFKTHLKYEKNPKIKEAIYQKFSEYLRRSGEIRSVLDDYFGPGPATKGEAGPGPTSAEQIRAELELWAIVREKPKVKWSDVAGLDTAKQALQEAFILPLKLPHFFTVTAIVKSYQPSWSPAAIMSAIMTTAMVLDNTQHAIGRDPNGTQTTPFDYGSGHISPTGALNPGLVYDFNSHDIINFLCSTGASPAQLKNLTGELVHCKNPLTPSFNFNYPSIGVANMNRSLSLYRTVTYYGKDPTVYVASIDYPTGVEVKVPPAKLKFTKVREKMSFRVDFIPFKNSNGSFVFGSLTWSNGIHRVRSPIGLNEVSV